MSPDAPRNRTHTPLDARSIARAALQVIDDDGLDRLTMRRLGRELGVEAMSIYHHLPDKAAVLRAAVEVALEPTTTPAVEPDPVATIERLARGLRDLLLAHPNLVPLVSTEPADHLSSAMTAAARDQLVASGVDDQVASWIIESVVASVLGQVVIDVAGSRRTTEPADAAFETGLRLLLTGLRSELDG